MEKHMTNREILKEAQMKIIARSESNPYYPIEQHMEDYDLIAFLEMLKMKYK
jgi:hypothetical protein